MCDIRERVVSVDHVRQVDLLTLNLNIFKYYDKGNTTQAKFTLFSTLFGHIN